jgi:ABC-type sugar transport system substrate-binding protein
VRRSTRRWLAAIGGLALAGAHAGAHAGAQAASTDAAATTDATTATSGPGCDPSVTHSAEDIAAAAAPYTVTSIYAVPVCFADGAPTLAYLPFDLSIPILLEYNDGVEDAAEFYGAELLVSDLAGQTAETLNRYEALTARDPDVIGTMINDSDNALNQRVQSDGRELLLSGPSFSQPPAEAPSVYPVDIDAEMGTEVGAMLGELAAERLEDQWSGRNVVFIGVGDDDNPIVKTRTDSALAAAREHIDIEDEDVVRLDTDGDQTNAQNMTLDALTAHPDDVFVIAPLNDETGVAAAQAVRDAGRQADAMVVLHGGGAFARDAMRNDTDDLILGAIYQNAYAEGWAWVEAAIALHLGDEFEDLYTEHPRITPDNVDELFPED